MSFQTSGEIGRIQKLIGICNTHKINMQELIIEKFDYHEVEISQLGGIWINGSTEGEMLCAYEIKKIADYIEEKVQEKIQEKLQ